MRTTFSLPEREGKRFTNIIIIIIIIVINIIVKSFICSRSERNCLQYKSYKLQFEKQ